MRPVLLAFLAVFAFAANSLTARAALADEANDPVAFALLRLVAGAVILGGFLKARPTLSDLPGSAALSVYMLGFALAYTSMSTAMGALILFSAVQLTILAMSALGGARLGIMALCGCAIALIGLFFLLQNGLGEAPVLAIVAMLSAGAAWGVYTVLGRASTAPVQQTGRQFLMASVLCLPAALALDRSGGGVFLTIEGALLAVASGAVFSGLGYALWYAVSPKLPAATVASVQLLTPVMAAAMGAAFLAEPITLRFVGASLVILCGVALTLRKD